MTNTSAAAGNVGGYLLFENASRAACTLDGAPTLIARTDAGVATLARTDGTVGTPFPSVARPPLVTLRPGEKAFAAYGGSDNSIGICPPPYHSFNVTPPDNTDGVDLPAFNADLDQDQPACAGIGITVIAPASEVEQFADLSSLHP